MKINFFNLIIKGEITIQSNFKWNIWTALMTACHYGNSKLVQLLVNANASLDLEGNTFKD